jgi:signal transduction histidine kinase
LRDIIRRKESKQNGKNLNKQIIQADKMVTIGQLAGSAAHELNNPLTGVLGSAQILLSKIPRHNPWYEMVRGYSSTFTFHPVDREIFFTSWTQRYRNKYP